ncbi:hypothetical protein ACFYXF_33070 [Streptomyces sp. NPDC002680]|uniref:hypothetical protein n=1 Tax=Streptomyces sp. NPDC002680 TaxID=3364659 RepID=UPI003688333B
MTERYKMIVIGVSLAILAGVAVVLLAMGQAVAVVVPLIPPFLLGVERIAQLLKPSARRAGRPTAVRPEPAVAETQYAESGPTGTADGTKAFPSVPDSTVADDVGRGRERHER